MGKYYQQPICQGQIYLLLSLAKSCDKVFLLNVDPKEIKLSKSALEEIVQMSKELLFMWQHPQVELNSCNIFLFNIRSEHFLSDKIYSSYASPFCLTEANINDGLVKHIDKIMDD